MSNSEIERDELPIEPHEDLSTQTNDSDKIEEIVEPSKPVLTEEELAKVISHSDSKKLEGNDLYRSGSYDQAIELYTEALEGLPDDHILTSQILCNRAACHVALKSWKLVIDDTTRALEIQPTYTKALHRRANAHESLEKYTEAIEDYKKLAELDPSLKLTSTIEKLEQQQKIKQEKETEEMMGQLKDLGNKFLGLFGLSTDNFKAEKDESGSYKINFQK